MLSTDRRAGHADVPVLGTSTADWAPIVGFFEHLDLTGSRVGDELVDAANRGRHLLPAHVVDALRALADEVRPVGALLVRGVPTGELPTTPNHPGDPTGKDLLSEFILLAVARTLGEPVGYRPEHGGDLVQNLLPTHEGAMQQTSTSSAVELEFHTETAFHPHRPRHLLLSCLKGDPEAATLLCSIREVLDELSPETRRALGEPRFRTRVDESFGASADAPPGELMAVLSGDPRRPTLIFDAELMSGDDPDAVAALDELRRVTRDRRIAVVLEAGDLLVVDNHVCIHGRTAFTARHDGSDRWLQRSFVVEDLIPSTDDRTGRIITTDFSGGVAER